MSHRPTCRTYIAANCPVGIECEHGYDVCPICDPCTCDQLGRGTFLAGASMGKSILTEPMVSQKHVDLIAHALMEERA